MSIFTSLKSDQKIVTLRNQNFMSAKNCFSHRFVISSNMLSWTIQQWIEFQFFKRANSNFLLKKDMFYNKSFVFDTHFFVFVIRIKLFLMSLLTMAFKKSFLYKTYSLWTFSKIFFFYLQGTKKCCSLCGTLTVPSDLRRVFLWFF